jgi:hypothetical protein
MKKILSVLIISTMYLFTGCIEITTLVKVAADGSGTIEEKVMISKEIVSMIRELSESVYEEEPVEKFELFNEDELRSQANVFGEGVEYLKGWEVSDETKEGFIAVYNYPDLNKLTINQNPSAKIPLGSIEETDEPEQEIIKYEFIPGSPAEIRISFIDMMDPDQTYPDTNAAADDSAYADTTFNEVAKLMKDMKMALYMEVDGKIVETNSSFNENGRITLFEIDFNELLENEAKFDEFKKLQPQTFEQFKDVIKDIPGIKVETNQPVIIKFQ